MSTSDLLALAALIFGFGLIVFFHELGHFLAAKWVGIKVEQFAIGFGHAIISWRKGMGWTFGSSGKRFEERLREHLSRSSSQVGQPPYTPGEMAQAAAQLGISETEYRLNWMPLGGYVKMLGQDDLNPNAQSDDPRSFNRKSVGARMLVVSAGVVMNVIAAAILFMAVFLIGLRVQPPVIGTIVPGSPAQAAGLAVGDRVLYLNGEFQHDFAKLRLNTALLPADTEVPITVLRNGAILDLKIRPQKEQASSGDVYSLGLGSSAMPELRGLDSSLLKKIEQDPEFELDPRTEVLPGDSIVAIEGVSVRVSDYPVLDRMVQSSRGRPVRLTVRNSQGQDRQVLAPVSFQGFFDRQPFNLAGLLPRPLVTSIQKGSLAKDRLFKQDVFTALVVNGERRNNPSIEQFVQFVSEAGAKGWPVGFVVERQGKRLAVEPLVPDRRTAPGKRGIGITLSLDEQHPIVANVLPDSPAAKARIPPGARILEIDGQPVENWFDIHQLLARSTGSATIRYQALDEQGQPSPSGPQQATLLLEASDLKALASICYTHNLLLHESIELRKTRNPLLAAAWGITETRDLLLQFYLTLRRLAQGSVSAKNLMGPIGIVHAGSFFAEKGLDWLIWFLAMISANLAVVNFLPIPIVDGGLFTFLLIEKIMGRPPSPRVQTAAQIVGLAIIVSVFLLVTYQDIVRLWL